MKLAAKTYQSPIKGKWKYLYDIWIQKANNDQNLGWFVFNNPELIGAKYPVFIEIYIKPLKCRC